MGGRFTGYSVENQHPHENSHNERYNERREDAPRHNRRHRTKGIKQNLFIFIYYIIIACF